MGSVLFAGGRLESVKVLAGAPSDNAGDCDAAYSDASLLLTTGDRVRHFLYDAAMAATTIAAGHVAFFHAYWSVAHNIFAGGGYMWRFADNAGTERLRLVSVPSGDFWLEYLAPGAVWTQIGPSVHFGDFVAPLDIVLTIDAGGNHNVGLYYGGTQTLAGGDFTSAALTNIAAVIYSGGDSYYGSHVSQMLVTVDLSTIGAHVKTTRATGAGTYGDWLGTYADVNSVADTDGTGNQSTVDGDKTTYEMGNIAVPAGYVIPTAFHWLRAKNDAGDPGNVKSLIRSGATDGTSGVLAGIGLGYGAIGFRYDADPATTTPWTQASWNAPVQLGFESAA